MSDTSNKIFNTILTKFGNIAGNNLALIIASEVLKQKKVLKQMKIIIKGL